MAPFSILYSAFSIQKLRCLDERGGLDLAYLATLASVTPAVALEALGERVYRIPGTSQYELADVYLSGNVVAKLRNARVWAERDPVFARNVAALEAVQPTPLGPKEIILNLNAFWLPSPVVTAFIKTLLPAWAGEAYYITSLGEWVLSDPGKQGAFAVEATTRWGTRRADAVPCAPDIAAVATAEPDGAIVPVLAGVIEQIHPTHPARAQFGNALTPRRAPRPEHREAEVHQLPLF